MYKAFAIGKMNLMCRLYYCWSHIENALIRVILQRHFFQRIAKITCIFILQSVMMFFEDHGLSKSVRSITWWFNGMGLVKWYSRRYRLFSVDLKTGISTSECIVVQFTPFVFFPNFKGTNIISNFTSDLK